MILLHYPKWLRRLPATVLASVFLNNYTFQTSWGTLVCRLTANFCPSLDEQISRIRLLRILFHTFRKILLLTEVISLYI